MSNHKTNAMPHDEMGCKDGIEKAILEIVRGGERDTVCLEIHDTSPAALVLVLGDGVTHRFEEEDLFVCLRDVRRYLELDDWLLCCQGARSDVFPSGLLRQMSNGRQAYALVAERPVCQEDVVDVFAATESSKVATVDGQAESVMRLLRGA